MLKKYALLCSLLALIIILLSACSTTSPTQPPLNTTPGMATTPTTPTTLTTVCPQAGTARAALMPSLTLGNHPNIIYYYSDFTNPNDNASLLKRVDVTTQANTQITRLRNADITEAQVSPERQWILFLITVNNPHNHVELRLIRVDGQYQQTLFCMPMSGYSSYSGQVGQFVWSPDRKSVAILGLSGQYNLPAIYIVDLTQGQVQLTLESTLGPIQKGPSGSYPLETEVYAPVKWLDNAHVYIGGVKTRSSNLEPNQYNLYLLDIGKGANQHNGDLQRVFSESSPFAGQSFCDFDSSSDGSQLFVARCNRQNGQVQTQGAITVQPATGGQPKTIFSTQSFAIVGIRVLNAHTLLLLTISSAGNGYSGDGLWKINTDGTGLTRLATATTSHVLTWCSFLQQNCSNVSLDGSMYAIFGSTDSGDAVFYGSLDQNSLHKAVSVSSLYESIVGWTEM